MTKEKSRLNPDTLKIYSSPLYRKKIKRVVESIKALRGTPWGTKLPVRPRQLKADATEKERDQAAKINNYRPTRETAHYWAQGTEFSYDRRAQRPAQPQEEQE